MLDNETLSDIPLIGVGPMTWKVGIGAIDPTKGECLASGNDDGVASPIRFSSGVSGAPRDT